MADQASNKPGELGPPSADLYPTEAIQIPEWLSLLKDRLGNMGLLNKRGDIDLGRATPAIEGTGSTVLSDRMREARENKEIEAREIRSWHVIKSFLANLQELPEVLRRVRDDDYGKPRIYLIMYAFNASVVSFPLRLLYIQHTIHTLVILCTLLVT